MRQLLLLVKYQMKPETRTLFVDEVISSGVLEKIKEEDGFISCYKEIKEKYVLNTSVRQLGS